MKNLTKFIAAISLVVGLNCFATGAAGVNPPQSGVISFTNGGVVSNVFTFPYAYQSTPVVKFFSDTTNATPLTNSAVSSTGFTLYIATSTNANIAWSAYVGTPRIQAGVATNAAATATTVTFSSPYAYTPQVVLTGGNTNINAISAITSITPSNFVFQCSVANTNQWMSFGISPLQSDSLNTSSGSNPVRY